MGRGDKMIPDTITGSRGTGPGPVTLLRDCNEVETQSAAPDYMFTVSEAGDYKLDGGGSVSGPISVQCTGATHQVNC